MADKGEATVEADSGVATPEMPAGIATRLASSRRIRVTSHDRVISPPPATTPLLPATKATAPTLAATTTATTAATADEVTERGIVVADEEGTEVAVLDKGRMVDTSGLTTDSSSKTDEGDSIRTATVLTKSAVRTVNFLPVFLC